jgi:hypothetical protein
MAEIRITSNGETARAEIPDIDAFLTSLQAAGNVRVRLVDDHGWIVVNPTTLAVLQLQATPSVVETTNL